MLAMNMYLLRVGRVQRLTATSAGLMRVNSSSANATRALHLGRATVEHTQQLNAEAQAADPKALAAARLRVGERGSAAYVHVARRGSGSPYIWGKDVPRIDASRNAVEAGHCNFLQVNYVYQWMSERSTLI